MSVFSSWSILVARCTADLPSRSLAAFAVRSPLARATSSIPAKGLRTMIALAISPSASGRTSRKSGSISAYLESQSFFRSYGSILPTSLVCIVRYRPEATRLGDLLRSIGTRSHEIQLHLPGFSRDGSEAPDDAQHGRRFSAAPPTASPLDAIPRSTYFWRPYQEKRALPGLLSHRLRGCLRRRQAPDRANGPKANLRVEARESMPDSLSVGQGRARAHRVALAVPAVSRHLAATLRRGYTTIDRRSRGTLLHFGLRGFRLNVCYYHQDLHRRPLRPSSRPGLRRDRRARLLERACVARSLSCLVVHAFDGARARRSSAIHFQGRSIRQVSRYTFLSGCRLPWPPTCCLYRSTPFVGSDERRVGRLVSAFGSSRIASPAYQEWPTRQKKSSSAGGLFPASRRRSAVHELRNASAFCAPSRRLPIESSRIGRGLFVPDRSASAFGFFPSNWAQPLIVRFTRHDFAFPCRLSWGKLRREPAIRRFDWSFAPTLRSDDRFARQNRGGLPPDFRPASACPSVVHHLSGPCKCTSVRAALCRASEETRYATPLSIRPAADVGRPAASRLLAFASHRGFSSRSFLFACACVRLLGPCFKTGRQGRSRMSRGLSVVQRRRSSLPDPSETSEARVAERRAKADRRFRDGATSVPSTSRAGRGLLRRRSTTAAKLKKLRGRATGPNAGSPSRFLFLRTVSRSLWLSLQSPFQLSLAVLVRCRSRGRCRASDGANHPASGCVLKRPDSRTDAPFRPRGSRAMRARHPRWAGSDRGELRALASRPTSTAAGPCATCRRPSSRSAGFGARLCSLFHDRRFASLAVTEKTPVGFFFHRLVICLNSAGSPARPQVSFFGRQISAQFPFLSRVGTFRFLFTIAHLLNNLFLFVMQTFKLLYASLKLQVFFFANLWLSEMLFYAVKINIAYSLNRSFLFAMQTIKSLYVSPKLQVFFC